MKKRIIIVLLVLVVLVGGWLIDLLRAAGQFKTIQPHFAGVCTEVVGLDG
ncbi:MAG: hypothetical protein GY866_32470, partial [Proteobacteria bacterium]|nr:hypothetical protein [Pseudomonadota bacterium]